MNFLLEITVQSVASQANIQETITCNTINEDTTGNEIQIASGNTVAIQVDFQKINAYNTYSTNSEVIITSEDEVIN